MRVTSIGLAGGRFPLAPVLDWLGAALRSPALESQRSATSAESEAAADALGARNRRWRGERQG